MKTEINIYIVLFILLVHWIADFIIQTDEQAKGKSKNWSDLLSHTISYSCCWLLLTPFLLYNVVWFILITFIGHTITDYFSSRLNSKLWARGSVHNFFVSVGFDQLLHFTQLLLTYQLLS
jgi:hypothetical protein